MKNLKTLGLIGVFIAVAIFSMVTIAAPNAISVQKDATIEAATTSGTQAVVQSATNNMVEVATVETAAGTEITATTESGTNGATVEVNVAESGTTGGMSEKTNYYRQNTTDNIVGNTINTNAATQVYCAINLDPAQRVFSWYQISISGSTNYLC